MELIEAIDLNKFITIIFSYDVVQFHHVLQDLFHQISLCSNINMIELLVHEMQM